MKIVLVSALLLTLGGAAQAKLAPFEAPRPTSSLPEESAMLVGPAGATLESDYFRAPRSPFSNTHICRLKLPVFDKTQLAQSCN